jgi:endonuclease/exonuclease/phosphatase family metal-dependent hydrolase
MLLPLVLGCVAPPPETGTPTTPPTTPSTDPSATPPGTGTADLVVAGFNVESGGSDIDVVADEVVAAMPGIALWGFVEVEDEAAADVLAHAAGELESFIGTTGWEDRMVLAWDPEVVDVSSVDELDWINIGGTARAPVVGTVEHRATGTAFLFVVNHLWRTDNDARHEQAALLHDWVEEQALPVVMVGDYNFDWDVSSDGADYHDVGYDALTAGGVVEWVKIDPLEKTQCSSYYDSVLDFTFVSGDAQGWAGVADLPDLPADYCTSDEGRRSDHKPVIATFALPAPSP